MRNNLSKFAFAAMLYASLLLSCTPDIEPIPELEDSSSSGTSSSNVVVLGSSSSLLSSSSNSFVISSSSRVSSSSVAIPSSSSSLVPSSSSVLAYNYCVFIEEKICLLGPMTSCPSGGVLSNSCPYGSSSSVSPSSSSILPSSSSSILSTSGTFTDTRDSKSYKWVKIGEQYWMAENLNYDATGSKCYSNSEANCTTYGKLYDWATAMALQASCNSSTCASQVGAKHSGICPSGWHIPNDAEWDALMTAVGGSSTAGTKLKATSGWNSSGNGQDTYGFSALPGGNGYSSGNFYGVGLHCYWWSATEFGASLAYIRDVDFRNANVSSRDGGKSDFISVRCIQD